MLIKELSCNTGASIRSIRHYESRGLINSQRSPNGYRNYENDAIARVKTIQLYLSLGLNTAAIGKIIDCPILPHNNHPICQEAYTLYKTKYAQVKAQIQILQQIQSQLEEKMKEFEQSTAETSNNEMRREYDY